MISWIQKYFQRHFKLVMVLILVAMGVPLIVVFTPSSGIGQGGQRVLSQNFFGYNMGSPEGQSLVYGDASISVQLQMGTQTLSDDQLQQYALQRVAALHLADLWHIPESTETEIKTFLTHLPPFTGEDGHFDPALYSQFRNRIKSSARVTEGDVLRVVGDDVRYRKVHDLIAGPGYVLDAEIKAELTQSQTQWTLAIASIDYANFAPPIEPTSQQLEDFFKSNSFRYEIGPRASLDYIYFPASNYAAQIQLTEDKLKAAFEAAPGRFHVATGTDGNTRPATATDFETVHDQVAAFYKLRESRQLATKAASDLTLAFYKGQVKNDPDNLRAFLEEQHLTAKSMEPFTREAGSTEFPNSPQLTKAAFDLNGDRYYSDAVPLPQGAVVLLWKETLPKRTPLLVEVRDQVTSDYIENEKRKAFAKLGHKLKADIIESVSSGHKFDQAVQVAATRQSVKATTPQLPSFTLSQPPQDIDYAALGTLVGLAKGDLSNMVITQDKGLLVYVIDKVHPNLTPQNPEYTRIRGQLATYTSQSGANAILSEMVNQELKKSLPNQEG